MSMPKAFTGSITVVTIAATAVLFALQPAIAKTKGNPTARSLDDVRSIAVQGNLCPSRIRAELVEHGFMPADSAGRADAVLKVDVVTDGGLHDQDTMEKGGYRAELIGADNRVLYTTHGFEDSTNLGSLCDEIGEEIGDDLEDRLDS